MKVQYIDAIPSSNCVKKSNSLNVLSGAKNLTNDKISCCVILWGRSEDGWKCLSSQEIILKGKEHRHLYFNIPEQCFTPAWWNQSMLEEIELLVSDEKPGAYARGVLIFMEEC